jgi:hypothetical protein
MASSLEKRVISIYNGIESPMKQRESGVGVEID